MRLFALLLILPLLCGCSTLQSKIVMDAAGAEALATAAGDTQAIPCFAAIDADVKATQLDGLLSKFEAFRVAQVLSQGPCSSVFAGLTLHILNKVPFTP